MRVLFVNAIDNNKKVHSSFPPLGLGYLSAIIKNTYAEVDVKIVHDNFECELDEYIPDLVGVTCVSENYGIACDVARLARKRGIPVVIGGAHISLSPESLFEEFCFGVMGEAEHSILDVVNLYLKNASPGIEEISKIGGLVYKVNGELFFTPKRPLIKDIDLLPMPDRDALGVRGDIVYMFTSRGCPYKCSFCASTKLWDKVRWHSAEYVVEEIEQIISKYFPRVIVFYDDLFIANRKRLREIIDLLVIKGLQDKVQFTFSCRANLVNSELIEILKPIKIYMVSMGLESGSQTSLDSLKGAVTVADNARAIELLVSAHIKVQATFVLGAPNERLKDMVATFRFILKSRLEFFEVYLLTPFPGTKIWADACKLGLVSDQMDWTDLSVSSMCRRGRRHINMSAVSGRVMCLVYYCFRLERLRRLAIYRTSRLLVEPGYYFKRVVLAIKDSL